jgi:quinoprotein glucose dehydrogenase
VAIRDSTCNACHGAQRVGLINVPALTNVARLSFTEFQTIVSVGKGQMPGFPNLEESAVGDLYTLLGGTNVVAHERRGGGFRGRGPRGYPEGVVAPTNNYRVAAGGFGLETPNLLKPPWSTITAYDLNKGTIKWQVPLGQDPNVVPMDGKMTGLPSGEQRRSMIVTSTGLVFATCADGKLYAYDADNGAVLWSTQLPRNTEGLPAMYEVNGRAYIAICLVAGTVGRAPGTLPPGYVVYGLPEKK